MDCIILEESVYSAVRIDSLYKAIIFRL